MKRIVLEVDDAVGNGYSGLTEESKQRLNRTFSLMVKKLENDAVFTDFSKLLDEIGNEAVKQGLTAEILDSLLASND